MLANKMLLTVLLHHKAGIVHAHGAEELTYIQTTARFHIKLDKLGRRRPIQS